MTTTAVHQCLFCPQTFRSAAEKDDHILQHFPQEICVECNQTLIRIGSNLYTLHTAATCVTRKLKTEPQFEPCFVEPVHLVNEQQETCIDIQSGDSETIIESAIRVKVEVESEYHPKELQTNSETIKKLDTVDNCYTSNETPGSQSDDEQISNDENEWLHSDSSMDLTQISESNTKTVSVTKYEQQDTSAVTSRENPIPQSNKQIKSNELSCTEESEYDERDKCESKEVSPKEKSSVKLTKDEVLLQYPKWTTTKSHFCEYCLATFLTAEELNEHTSECFVRKKDGPVECNICKKSLSSIRTLKQHKLLKHTPAETHVCRRCAKVFVTANELNKHRAECILKRKSRHGINKLLIDAHATIECYLCKKIFKSISSLFAHMRWKHNLDNVKYKCDICGMGFFSKSLQDMHLRRHTEPLSDQKVMCNVCGKFLTKGYSLKDHMRVHTGEKPFPCTYEKCTKSFSTNTARHIHMRSHNPEDKLKCPHEGCSKSFLSKPSLTIHLRSHSGEKPFKCPHDGCKKSFLTKSIIVSHMLIHSGEKPFKCTKYGCQKEFRTKGARDRHLGTNAHK